MASGDITPTTPRTFGPLRVSELIVSREGQHITLRMRDEGRTYTIILRDGPCTGVDYATGTEVQIDVPDAMTRALAAVVQPTGVTLLVEQIIADGILVIDGAVE